MTEAENLGEEDRQYGSGKDIGNELIKMLKDNEEAKVRMRQDQHNSRTRTYLSLLKEQFTSDENVLDDTDPKTD